MKETWLRILVEEVELAAHKAKVEFEEQEKPSGHSE